MRLVIMADSAIYWSIMIKQNKNSPTQRTPEPQRSGSQIPKRLASKIQPTSPVGGERRSSVSVPRERGSTPSKRQVAEDFQVYMQYMVKDLTQRKQRLQQCIKLFNLMQSQAGQLRCLQHNNVQTIYCVSERRVLCINCVYGASRHRTHKLLPLKDAGEYLHEDNTLLRAMIDTDLKNMDESIKYSQENSVVIERELKKQLQRLQGQFNLKSEKLKEKFESESRYLKKVFQGLLEKSRSLEKCTEEIKFKTWETLSKIGIGKRVDGSNMDIEVSKQVLCVTMSEITNVKVKRVTEREIDKIRHRLLKN